jgi:hypothetical protein
MPELQVLLQLSTFGTFGNSGKSLLVGPVGFELEALSRRLSREPKS